MALCVLRCVSPRIFACFGTTSHGIAVAISGGYNEPHARTRRDAADFRREAHLRRLGAVPGRRTAARVDRRRALRDAVAKPDPSIHCWQPAFCDPRPPRNASDRTGVPVALRRRLYQVRCRRTGSALYLKRATGDSDEAERAGIA